MNQNANDSLSATRLFYEVQSVEDSLRETERILGDVSDHGGARSKLFTSSAAGQELISKRASLSKSAETCVEVKQFLVEHDRRKRVAAEKACALLDLALDDASENGLSVACVCAPMFTRTNVMDGYNRRIMNVDELFGDAVMRIYLYTDPDALGISAERVDDLHLAIVCDPESDASAIHKALAKHVRVVYCHSIYRYSAQFMEECSAPFVLDFHGAVPEEIAYAHKNLEASEKFEKVEAEAIARSSAVVTVSNAMTEHIKEKYPTESEHIDFIVMPIMDTSLSIHPAAGGADGKPSVIYAGGVQPWQRVYDMFDAMAAQPDLCEYRIFIPQQELFDPLYGTRKRPSSLVVSTRTPDQLADEYAQCQFGFILRDDNTVNRVACPTKLIEYLAYDIIPIVDMPRIGDFANQGMQYVTLAEFLEGALPDRQRQEQMLAANRQCLQTLIDAFRNGRSTLEELFKQMSSAR